MKLLPIVFDKECEMYPKAGRHIFLKKIVAAKEKASPGPFRCPPQYGPKVAHLGLPTIEISGGQAFGSIQLYHMATDFVERGARGIDVASGLGIGTGILAQQSREVTGIEISGERIAVAREINTGRVNIRWVQMNVDLLKSGDRLVEDPVDYVVIIETIEHVNSPDNLMRVAWNSLREGGRVIVSAPTSQSTDYIPYHLHDFTHGDFLRLIERAGFRIIFTTVARQVRSVGWGNPIIPRRFMLWHTLSVYAQHPSKLGHRAISVLRHRGILREHTFVVAVKNGPLNP